MYKVHRLYDIRSLVWPMYRKLVRDWSLGGEATKREDKSSFNLTKRSGGSTRTVEVVSTHVPDVLPMLKGATKSFNPLNREEHRHFYHYEAGTKRFGSTRDFPIFCLPPVPIRNEGPLKWECSLKIDRDTMSFLKFDT